MPEGRGRSGSRGNPGESSGMISEKEKRRTNKPKEAVKKEKAKFGLGREAEAFRGPWRVPGGRSEKSKQESLILAQDERWRRA